MLEYTLIDDYADYDDHVCRPEPHSYIEQELDFFDWPPCDISASDVDSRDFLICMSGFKPIPPSAHQSSDENGKEYSERHSDRGVYASEKIIHFVIIYCVEPGVKPYV